MHDVIKLMLQKYECHAQQDYINALKEIFQEIALLGLWRAKFFEKAAFYGGSALRVLYGLDRFSEDLDFSLLEPDKNFNLHPYNKAIIEELAAYGFVVDVQTKKKISKSNIESAFIKADSKTQLITIEAPREIVNKLHHMQTIKIKMEVDINPPGLFNTETRFLLQPIPFSVKSFAAPDLFAGKIHALLCRPWVSRVKGRDWYDFAWYISYKTPVNLVHLKERLVQSKAWERKTDFTLKDLVSLLHQKIQVTDFDQAKNDIRPFISKPSNLDVWSREFFESLVEKMQDTKM